MFQGDAALWHRASDEGKMIIQNNLDEDVYLNEVVYGDVSMSAPDAELLSLEPGFHVVAHEPDYIMEISPDEVKAIGSDNKHRWELLCAEQLFGEFEQMLEELLEE
jgi:hypothetical protein